jgi:plastocyanin
MPLRTAPLALLGLALLAPGGEPPATVAGAPTPPALSVRGRLVLLEHGKPSSDSSIELSEGAVWYEPRGGTAPARPVTAEMVTRRKQFAPQLLVVPVGSTVRFPNQDPILHNVFSVSGGNRFDLGLVGAGQGKATQFREPGLVRVFCNVHHAMFAHVLVVGTRFFSQLGADGSFEVDGLPPGPGELHYWHERGDPAVMALSLPHAARIDLQVPITVHRVPAHKNKFGRSYSRSAYE